MTVGDILSTTANRDPHKVGLVFGHYRFTWSEVNSRVNRLANGLLRLGLKRQDRVAILSRACNQYMEFNLACAKAGLVQVALNHWSLGKELVHPISDSGARALVVHEEFVDRVKECSSQLGSVEYYIGIGGKHTYPTDVETIIRENPDHEPDSAVNGDDLYCLCYTSGTTGKPKGVMFDHNSVVAGTRTLALQSRIWSGDTFLMIIPFCFASHGASRFHAVLVGARCIVLNFEASEVLEAIQREEVSYMHIGPTALKMLLDHPHLGDYRVNSMRRMWITGGALSPELWDAAERVFGPVVAPTLGMTENLSCGAWFERNDLAAVSADVAHRLKNSVGKPCAGVRVRVVNEAGKDVARNGQDVGELLVRSDTLMKGYWNLPEQSAAALEDGWLHTGDIVSISEDGYVFFRDRKREMIKSGGMMVFPLEIEALIQSHPAVQHCAVIGVPHEKWGETPKAFVVLRAGMKTTANELMDLCRKNMASYKKPASIEIVEQLPFTVSGKVSKAELRKLTETPSSQCPPAR